MSSEYQSSPIGAVASPSNEKLQNNFIADVIIEESSDVLDLRREISNEALLESDDQVTEGVPDIDFDYNFSEHQVTTIDIWSIIKKSMINLFLPFLNGMMLGFGEILAHEIGFRYHWIGARVQPPERMKSRQKISPSKFL